jgi:hypothetical protein
VVNSQDALTFQLHQRVASSSAHASVSNDNVDAMPGRFRHGSFKHANLIIPIPRVAFDEADILSEAQDINIVQLPRYRFDSRAQIILDLFAFVLVDVAEGHESSDKGAVNFQRRSPVLLKTYPASTNART